MKNLKQTLSVAAFMLALLAGPAGAFEPQKDKDQKQPQKPPAVIKDQGKNNPPRGNDNPKPNNNNQDKPKKDKP